MVFLRKLKEIKEVAFVVVVVDVLWHLVKMLLAGP